MRHLDHIVWPTRDLAALAETFRRLGFTVGRRNRHPWGTENHVVQFDGFFLELLGFADDYRPVPPDDPAFPFAAFCADVLDHSAGEPAMLVLRSDDAVADVADFRARGLGSGRLLPFSRSAQGPDGSDRTVAFTVAFASLPGLPEIGAFTCQQHRPENFWSPAAQVHANGSVGLSAVVIAAPQVAEAVSALHAFAGQADGEPLPSDAIVRLGNGMLDVVAAPTIHAQAPRRARIVALHLACGDLARLAGLLKTNGITCTTGSGRVQVAAPVAGGADLVFHPQHA